MNENSIIKRSAAATPVVVKEANAEDEATGDAFEIFGFDKVRNRRGVVRIPRNEARKAEKVKELLISKNMDISCGDKQVETYVKAALASKPLEFVVYAEHVGWRKGFRRFVTADQVIGEIRNNVQLAPPLWLNDRQHVFLTREGKLDTWIKHVAAPCRFSTRLMVVMSEAFAAPLVRVMSLQPFGINIYGAPKAGKTTTLLAGTSLIGIGREPDLPNWNRTDAAFQELARLFNDQILGVNEVGLLAGKRGDAYEHIREAIYRFSEGRDRSRHSSWGVGNTAASASWCGIFVSTSEHSFNAYVAFSGETRDHGELARCLDISATTKGRPTIFDRCPSNIEKDKFDAWAKSRVIKLRKACAENCGVAIVPYIEHLIKSRGTLKTTVEELVREFVESVDVPEDNGALQHAAMNIGLIYAGGRLGIAAGLLPWKPGRLLTAVQSCFKAALQDLHVHEDIDRKVQKMLREKLAGKNVVLRERRSNFGPNDADGYFERDGNKLVYVIQAKALRSWFPVHAHQIVVLRWLFENGYLQQNSKRAMTSAFPIGAQTKALEQQRRWPDGSNPRCFVLNDPFGRKV
jgi:hypothetical protein